MKIAVAIALSLWCDQVQGSPIYDLLKRFTTGSPAETQVVNTTTFSYPQTQSAELFPMSSCKGITLEDATIDQLQDYFSKGSLTSEDVVRCYLDRYFQVNPYVNGILQVNPDAVAIAQEMDNERAQGINRGPLHGIPFVVKDNYATKDKMDTTAGSWMLLGSIVPRDAHVVKKLRDAGAVLFGHSTLSEWADMRSSGYSEGYSARGGQARCPFNLTVNPGGSSSGSAGAVAANMIPFSLGTETDGSIIDPAMRNGIVGFKPTVGLTSRAGVIPESEHQDSTGPMARTVKDAIYAFQYMWGVDDRDVYTKNQTGQVPADGDYLQFLADKSALEGAKFGLPWEKLWSKAKPDEIPRLLEVIKMIEDAGATVYNNTDFENQNVISSKGWNWDLGPVDESEFTVIKVDFYNNIKAYLSELENTKIRGLEDIVAYNYQFSGTEGGYAKVNPAFASGQDSFLDSLAWAGEKNETYWNAVDFVQRTSRKEGIDSALNYTDSETGENFQLDGLLVPSGNSITYQQAAKAGYPMITLPAGVKAANGRPFGLGIMQSAWQEPQLIRYGSAIEDLLQYKCKPQYFEYLAKNVPVV
ncbi:LANO_0C09758g1_1 [Lachancea nothofagi CBS 11611]|uniref:LANO_0C09758g1_1 n=1 Tax=Lachancea nothofagi CBS 11611 TaxID=1266666 RepID=A0A1G4JAB7_9SACH|nr:LANO_0C09758g1_1 [Lachancea nothofagi CBS 11611]